MHGCLFRNDMDLVLHWRALLSLDLKISIESTLCKVCGCYAVTYLNWPLDLIGTWFGEDQRPLIVSTRV